MAAMGDDGLAYRLCARQYAALAGRPVPRSGPVAHVVLLIVALPLLLAAPACLAAGVYLILAGPGISPYLGLLLVALAYVVRPRLPRPPADRWTVDRSSAPAFAYLVERVARACGAPEPDVIALDGSMDASSTVVGVLRRRRELVVGLPLLAALTPPERVALIAHELGHFVNHDARRGRFTEPAVLWAGYLLLAIGQRDGQRAEYLADEIAARVAGSGALAGMLDTLLVADRVRQVVRAGGRDPGARQTWLDAAAYVRAGTDLDLLRRRSVREQASLCGTHPPTGLRIRMAGTREYTGPLVVLAERQSSLIDRELAPWYARLSVCFAELP